jgi:imidazolonepropionase-like amidohydrolase
MMSTWRAARTWGPAVALCLSLAPSLVRAQDVAIAITHARVHPGDGRRIDDGVVVMRDGKIAAVGAAGEVAVPPGARVIDGQGSWVTPGLIDADAVTGLVDVALEDATVDLGLNDKYDAIRAAFSVIDGWNPTAIAIPITRIEGVTTSALRPRGGLVAGRGAVVRLDGDGAPAMTLRTHDAVYASLSLAGRAAGFGARGGQLLRLRELLDDVRQYARRRDDFEKNQMRKVSASRLDLEALVPVVIGHLPLAIEVHRAADIQAVLRLARDEKLRVILLGADEAWLVARDIAAAHVPVILSPLLDLPHSFESLGARRDSAALLHRAGVTIAITPREREDHYSRTLRFEAGNAVADGLPWNAALAAVTLNPAKIFDVADEVGSLLAGKSADLVMWSGDPFEPLARPRHVFIRGRDIPLTSRQTELRDRYRDLSKLRPRP